jgi:hypothetical protein
LTYGSSPNYYPEQPSYGQMSPYQGTNFTKNEQKNIVEEDED